MITNIRDDKLIVISDLHLGNPFCFSKRKIIEFLEYINNNGYNLCINGDGFDLAQTSIIKLAKEVPEVFNQFRRFKKKNLKVYYIIGNHDLVLEHFFEDWDLFTLTPFLNVISNDIRVRIEHGHLYDRFFLTKPDLYEFCTHFAGFFLNISPQLYRVWILFERVLGYLRRIKTKKYNIIGILGEPPSISEAAFMILERGFDAVVFGHTHHPGKVEVGDQKYFNTGSWLMHTNYIEILNGSITLKSYEF
jgi:UDP-2,3-diacylglucosamine pyrophosphatase LpxH